VDLNYNASPLIVDVVNELIMRDSKMISENYQNDRATNFYRSGQVTYFCVDKNLSNDK